MILEIASLRIKHGQKDSFENAFTEVEQHIEVIDGYISHELQHCIEDPSRYILLIKRQDIKNHTENLHCSIKEEHLKNFFIKYCDPFPDILRYKPVENIEEIIQPILEGLTYEDKEYIKKSLEISESIVNDPIYRELMLKDPESVKTVLQRTKNNIEKKLT